MVYGFNIKLTRFDLILDTFDLIHLHEILQAFDPLNCGKVARIRVGTIIFPRRVFDSMTRFLIF